MVRRLVGGPLQTVGAGTRTDLYGLFQWQHVRVSESSRIRRWFCSRHTRSFDIELGYRLSKLGVPLEYVPAAAARQNYAKRSHQIAADAYSEGASALRLATFRETTARSWLLRKFLLAAQVPPSMLLPAGRLIPSERWRDEWYSFLYTYPYWLGVRQSVSDVDTWRRITSATPILLYHAFASPSETGTRYLVPIRGFSCPAGVVATPQIPRHPSR